MGELVQDYLHSNSTKLMSVTALGESASPPQLSVVVPFLNEQEMLPLLKERLCTLVDLPETYEFVFVSDGSTDQSVMFIEQWAAEDPGSSLLYSHVTPGISLLCVQD